MSLCCGERKNEVIKINKIENKGGWSWFLSKIGNVQMVIGDVTYKFNSKTPTKAPSGARKALFLQRVDEPIKEVEKKIVESIPKVVEKPSEKMESKKIVPLKEDNGELI
jgi:hypothetical protein